MTDSASPKREQERRRLQVKAGEDPQGRPVMEKLEVYVMTEKDCYELVHSPMFVRNLARGDVFRLEEAEIGSFTVLQRSGKLAIRVISRESVENLSQSLTPEVEKLEGTLDIETPRALVYSLDINIGFAAIEQLFDNATARHNETIWYYGNVYDPSDGVTPLQWWDEFINQV